MYRSELIADLEKGLDPAESKPDLYEREVLEFMESVRIRSSENIKILREAFFKDVQNHDWYGGDIYMALDKLDKESEKLQQDFENGSVLISHATNIEEFFGLLLTGGKLKSKYEIGNWGPYPKPGEKIVRTEVEDELGFYGLNPKYSAFGEGNNDWGDIFFVIDADRVEERASFTHRDSFYTGISGERRYGLIFTYADAIRSRAMLNIEKSEGKEYTSKHEAQKTYTEGQIFGKVRIGKEIQKILVPSKHKPPVKNFFKEHPELEFYKTFITYT